MSTITHPEKIIIIGNFQSSKRKYYVGDRDFLYRQCLKYDKFVKTYIVKIRFVNIEEFDLTKYPDAILVLFSGPGDDLYKNKKFKRLNKLDRTTFVCSALPLDEQLDYIVMTRIDDRTINDL